MTAPGALDGLLVADFSRVLAGPLCAMTLGDLGADVVKVERPQSGDDTRHWGPPTFPPDDPDGTATYYLALNRNKRSLTLDFGDDADLELARRLAERADVLIESFRPGLMARFGLDHASVAARNPGVVYCSVSAFGSGEAAATLPGYDLLLQAMSGLMHVTGEADGRPLKAGAPLVDVITGLYATIGVLGALQARTRTGEGQHVEVSLMDAALSALLNQASAHVAGGASPTRLGNRHPSISPYETFRAADRDFVVAAANDTHFGRVCVAIGRPELATDPRFATNPARSTHRDALAAELESVFGTAPAAEWVERLRAAGVPVGPIHDLDEAFAFAESLGLDPVDRTGGVPTVRSPLRLSATPASVRRPPPALGADDAELRAWLERPQA